MRYDDDLAIAAVALILPFAGAVAAMLLVRRSNRLKRLARLRREQERLRSDGA